jgi:hypothetical protein
MDTVDTTTQNRLPVEIKWSVYSHILHTLEA